VSQQPITDPRLFELIYGRRMNSLPQGTVVPRGDATSSGPRYEMLPSGNNAGMDRFNDQLRANPQYRAFLQSLGVNPNGPIRLTGHQRSRAEQFVRAQFPQLASKFQIDPAGNVNTDHGLSTAWSNPYFRYPLLAAGAVGTAGALGAFGGAAGAGGAAGTGAGVLPSSSLATMPLGQAGAAMAGTSAAPGLVGASGAPGFFSSVRQWAGTPGGREAIGLGGQLLGGYMQHRANSQAADDQLAYLREALAEERRRDERQQAQYLEERGRLWSREDARDSRLAPFRANAGQGYRTLSSLLAPQPEVFASPLNIPRRDRKSLAALL